VDAACLETYRELHHSNHNYRGQLASGGSASGVTLTFRPYQVQKCVSIYKDYKFKVELLLCLQVLMLALIANAQYSVYGLPFLTLVVVQLLYIALTHGRTDQEIRVASSWITIFLLAYLPLDLFYHYCVHCAQESERLDDQFQS
jgi:hypothetical protein